MRNLKPIARLVPDPPAQNALEMLGDLYRTNGNTGQLLLRVTPIANARAYEVRYAVAPAGGVQGPWQSGGLFTNSRSIPVNGLTPGRQLQLPSPRHRRRQRLQRLERPRRP